MNILGIAIATTRMVSAAGILSTSALLGNVEPEPRPTPQSSQVAAQPFAIIELFTSEGCSSCPPADKLLGEIASEARRSGRNIFSLAFHVDYWNSLGWVDPYSDQTYSRRQRAYGRAFKIKRSYTPQMIVNGTEQFVGSDRAKVHESVQTALTRPAPVRVTLRAKWQPVPETVAVSYEVVGARAEKLVLHIALVERGLNSKVSRGENAGRTLTHDNVVRVFKTVPLRDGTKRQVELKLKIPPTIVQQNAIVMAYVQDPTSMVILGAASAAFGSARPE